LDKDQGRSAIISDRHLGTVGINRTVTLLLSIFPSVGSFFFVVVGRLAVVFAFNFPVTDHPTKTSFPDLPSPPSIFDLYPPFSPSFISD
jgi:hypothetical protein